MERIGFLINKLKEQYEEACSQDSMLVTLQMLYRELLPKMGGGLANGGVSIMVPGQMELSFLDKSVTEEFKLDTAPQLNGKKVFELPAEPLGDVKPVDKQQVAEPEPVNKQFVTAIDAPKNPFVVVSPKVEAPVAPPEQIVTAAQPEPIVTVPPPEQIVVEKPKEEEVALPEKTEIANEINARFMPQKPSPIIEPPVVEPPIVEPLPFVSQSPLLEVPQPLPKVADNPAPPKEVHEAIQMNKQPSFNDNVEKRQPELFHVLKAEPLKDLKKAISINERFQYINHLFMKDETMYDRSLKTINGFNVISEAKFWIRKELAVKMGWDDNDEVVQQFMHLVERRFA